MINFDHSATGNEFEKLVQTFFARQGLILSLKMDLPVGIGNLKKNHRFDLGCEAPPVIVECKCHAWTEGRNSPSAKLSVWNEAMLYFLCAPKEYRKIFAVTRSFKGNLSLARHYLNRYFHLVPTDVEFWEFDPITGEGTRLIHEPKSSSTDRTAEAFNA